MADFTFDAISGIYISTNLQKITLFRPINDLFMLCLFVA